MPGIERTKVWWKPYEISQVLHIFCYTNMPRNLSFTSAVWYFNTFTTPCFNNLGNFYNKALSQAQLY